MRPYEYMVWLSEKRDSDDEIVETAEVLVKPTLVMARDDKAVGIIAARALPDGYEDRLDRVHIEVRPFFA